MQQSRLRRRIANLLGLLSGTLLLGGVVGAILLVMGVTVVVGLFVLAFYVMGDPCSPAAELFDGGRPPYC